MGALMAGRKPYAVKHEHIIERSGWTIVIRAVTGREFMAHGALGAMVLGRAFYPTRKAARAFAKELREKGIGHPWVSRATVRFQRHA